MLLAFTLKDSPRLSGKGPDGLDSVCVLLAKAQACVAFIFRKPQQQQPSGIKTFRCRQAEGVFLCDI